MRTAWPPRFGDAVAMGLSVSEAEPEYDVLLLRAAEHYEVDVDLLVSLLALERDYPDFSVFGSKAQFTRAVAAVLDAAVAKAGAS